MIENGELWRKIVQRLDDSPFDWRARVDALGQLAANDRREAGEVWANEEVFDALVTAVLSANASWSKVERVLPEVCELLRGFDLVWYAGLAEADIDDHLVPWFKARKAGTMTLRRALVCLIEAAGKLARHARLHGAADGYFTALLQQAEGDPKRAALLLGTHPAHKLPGLGVPLAAETLRNLGFDVAKPDRHVLRAMGCFKLADFGAWSSEPARRAGTAPPGQSPKRQMVAMEAVENIARSAGERVIFVDAAIWLLCAKDGLYLANADLEKLASDGGPDGFAALLESWMREDPTEQQETLAHLVRSLDENRPTERKLFPQALKGKTW